MMEPTAEGYNKEIATRHYSGETIDGYTYDVYKYEVTQYNEYVTLYGAELVSSYESLHDKVLYYQKHDYYTKGGI